MYTCYETVTIQVKDACSQVIDWTSYSAFKLTFDEHQPPNNISGPLLSILRDVDVSVRVSSPLGVTISHLTILPDPPTTLSIRSLAKVGPWRFLATMSVKVVTIDNPFLCHEIERSRHAFQMYTWLPQCINLFEGQELHRSPFVLCFATAGVIISLLWCDFPGIGAKSGTSAKFWILGKSRARLSHSFRNRNSNDFPF